MLKISVNITPVLLSLFTFLLKVWNNKKQKKENADLHGEPFFCHTWYIDEKALQYKSYTF